MKNGKDNKTMKDVNIADFVLYAQEKRQLQEIKQLEEETKILEVMTKKYYIEIAYLVINTLILLCGVGILEALSR